MLKRLTDRIYYLPYERENDRPNLYYILGDKFSVAIDAGNSKEHIGLFYREIDSLGLKRPAITIITHWHWDHTFAIHAAESIVMASKLTNAKLRDVQKWDWNTKSMAEREKTGEDIEFCNNCIQIEYDNLDDIIVKPADIEIEDKLTINPGDVACMIEHRDAPHSRDSLFVLIPEENAMVIGDADCEDYYDNNGMYDKDKLKDYIDYIRGIDFEHYLISHDLPITKSEALEYLESQL